MSWIQCGRPSGGDPRVRRGAAVLSGTAVGFEGDPAESEPPPILRAAPRGWVGYLDEVGLHRLTRRDITQEEAVQLAVDALITGLRSAAAHNADISAMLRELNRAA